MPLEQIKPGPYLNSPVTVSPSPIVRYMQSVDTGSVKGGIKAIVSGVKNTDIRSLNQLSSVGGVVIKKIPLIQAVLGVGEEGIGIVSAVRNLAEENSTANLLAFAQVGPASGVLPVIDKVAEIATGVSISTAIRDAGEPQQQPQTAPTPASTAVGTAIQEQRKSRPCPLDGDIAADGSKCGGRSAFSKGKTTDYDTDPGFFDQF